MLGFPRRKSPTMCQSLQQQSKKSQPFCSLRCSVPGSWAGGGFAPGQGSLSRAGVGQVPRSFWPPLCKLPGGQGQSRGRGGRAALPHPEPAAAPTAGRVGRWCSAARCSLGRQHWPHSGSPRSTACVVELEHPQNAPNQAKDVTYSDGEAAAPGWPIIRPHPTCSWLFSPLCLSVEAPGLGRLLRLIEKCHCALRDPKCHYQPSSALQTAHPHTAVTSSLT